MEKLQFIVNHWWKSCSDETRIKSPLRRLKNMGMVSEKLYRKMYQHTSRHLENSWPVIESVSIKKKENRNPGSNLDLSYPNLNWVLLAWKRWVNDTGTYFRKDQNTLWTLHFWNCHSMTQNWCSNAIYHTIYSVTFCDRKNLSLTYLYADDTTIYCIAETMDFLTYPLNNVLAELRNGATEIRWYQTQKNVKQWSCSGNQHLLALSKLFVLAITS